MGFLTMIRNYFLIKKIVSFFRRSQPKDSDEAGAPMEESAASTTREMPVDQETRMRLMALGWGIPLIVTVVFGGFLLAQRGEKKIEPPPEPSTPAPRIVATPIPPPPPQKSWTEANEELKRLDHSQKVLNRYLANNSPTPTLAPPPPRASTLMRQASTPPPPAPPPVIPPPEHLTWGDTVREIMRLEQLRGREFDLYDPEDYGPPPPTSDQPASPTKPEPSVVYEAQSAPPAADWEGMSRRLRELETLRQRITWEK